MTRIIATLVLLAVSALAHAADPITFLASPVNITPTDDGTFRTVDVSASCTDGVTSGVLLRTRFSAATSNDGVGFRKTGSTDAYQAAHLASPVYTYTMIGVDATGQLDILIEDGGASGAGTVELLACLNSSHVVFFNNAITTAPAATTWTDWDISAATGGDTAIAAILYLHTTRANVTEVGWRKNGSTEAILADAAGNTGGRYMGTVIVPVDAAEILEVYQASTAFGPFKIVGYIKGLSYTTTDPGTDVSLGTTNTWTDITQSGCVAQMIDVVANAIDLTSGFRKNGDASTVGLGAVEGERRPALVDCDASGIIEGNVDNIGVDFYRRGYFTTEVLPPASVLTLKRRRH